MSDEIPMQAQRVLEDVRKAAESRTPAAVAAVGIFNGRPIWRRSLRDLGGRYRPFDGAPSHMHSSVETLLDAGMVVARKDGAMTILALAAAS